MPTLHTVSSLFGEPVMVRSFAIALLLATVPLAPAAAVVTIAMPAIDKPLPQPVRVVRPAADQSVLGLSYGEIAAALAGLAILGVALFNGRQPPSVTA